jgi:hypothetical protein
MSGWMAPVAMTGIIIVILVCWAIYRNFWQPWDGDVSNEARWRDLRRR